MQLPSFLVTAFLLSWIVWGAPVKAAAHRDMDAPSREVAEKLSSQASAGAPFSQTFTYPSGGLVVFDVVRGGGGIPYRSTGNEFSPQNIAIFNTAHCRHLTKLNAGTHGIGIVSMGKAGGQSSYFRTTVVDNARGDSSYRIINPHAATPTADSAVKKLYRRRQAELVQPQRSTLQPQT